MPINVTVSRVFSVSSEAEAKSSFQSLADAGWSVLVDQCEQAEQHPADNGDDRQGWQRHGNRLKRLAALINEIRSKHKITVAEIGRRVGVSAPTVCNYRKGRHGASRIVVDRLRRLLESEAEPQVLIHNDKSAKPTHRRVVRRLSADQLLDIAIRRESGETIRSLAREYGISRSRVSRIVCRLGA